MSPLTLQWPSERLFYRESLASFVARTQVAGTFRALPVSDLRVVEALFYASTNGLP